MFFEEEKDFINNGADIRVSEDGVVDWDDVLQASQDDLVNIKDGQQTSKASGETDDLNLIDLGDDSEFVQGDDENVSDDELAKILNDNNASEYSPKQKAFDAFGQGDDYSQDAEDDSERLKDVNLDDSMLVDESNIESSNMNASQSDDFIPRKRQVKKSSSSTGLLLALLFAILVAGGVYYAIDFTKNKNLAEDELLIPNKQEELNELTKEDIENREKENIPVVNEEEIAEIKPDIQEKKEVINVVQTGRPNPFMPIQKYMAVEVPQKVIQYDKAGIPAPPKEFGTDEPETYQLMNVSVSGIMYDDKKPSAIITFEGNDYFVQEGDMLDKFRIADIQKTTVAIAYGKNVYTATIGEGFKIDDGFYGVASYTSSGNRKYQKVDPSYVSESEVSVNTRSTSTIK